MRAVIYGRISTDRQSELSIEAQIDYCESYCQRNGWPVVCHYTDFGLSGTNAKKRPGLMQMLDDAKAGLFEVVVAHKVDRAFRNTRDYENVKYALEQSGVVMAFVETGLNDGGQGDFVNGLMALMAAQYSRNLSREVRKTIKKNVEAGNFLGGLPPMGYKIIDKKYELDEKTAPLVLYIFKSYASGEYSMKQLANELNSKGHRTSRGNKFTVSTIRGMLINEKYRGIYVHNLNQYRDCGRNVGKRENKQSEVLRLEGAIPRIISDELWEAVRNRMESNKRGQGRKNGDKKSKRFYMLSGLTKCKECGAGYVGQTSVNGKGYVTRYYACNGRKRKGDCPNKPINADWLENEVLKCVAKLCDEMDLEKLTRDVNNAIKELLQDQKQEIERQEALIKGLRREESNLVDAIAKIGINPALSGRLAVVQDDIKEAEQRLDAINPKIIPILDVKTVSKMFRLTIEDLRHGTEEEKRRAIRSVVQSVEISKDEVVVKIKAGLGRTGLNRDKVADNVVAEGGFEPPTSGL